MTSVVVIGGGVAGLTTADALVHGGDGHEGGHDVVVLEASGRVGGKLRTAEFCGQQVDLGADAFLARHPRGVALARRIGLGDDLTTPVTSSAHVWTKRGLRPLPTGTVLGVPTDIRALQASGVLPRGAVARAALEPLMPRAVFAGDRSVAAVIGDRFGRTVVDELVEPLLGGVYAGSADRLSISATVPPVAAALARPGSLTAELRAHRATTASAADAPVFHGLRAGMASLTDTLADRLGDRVHHSSPVVAITGEPGAWEVHLDDRTISAEVVVIAAPADVAADLLTDVARDAAAEAAAIDYASVAVVMLAYPIEVDRDLVAGSGMLVPRSRGALTKAATFVSRKWAERRADDHVLIRASVGRIDDDRWRSLTPDDLATRVDAEIRWATGIRVPATDRLVVPWERALPQYDVGHLDRVDRARRALPAGIHLAGAAWDGVGVAPCIASAEHVAREIAHNLRG